MSTKVVTGGATSTFSEEKERLTKIIRELSKSKAPENVKPYLDKAAPFLAMTFVGIKIAIPHIINAYMKLSELIGKLPEDLCYGLMGLCLCFFGGMYPLLIAAGEAFRMTGGDAVWNSCKELAAEAKKFSAANKKDDDLDEDGDGIADVNQVDAQALVLRKTHLFLTSVDPDTMNKGLAGVWTGYMAVLAALKIQFAKTVALGAAIGDILRKPASKYAEPALLAVVPQDYASWIPHIINYTCKTIAISIAWFIQRIISAFHSAIRGGLMFSRNIIKYGNKQGYCNIDTDESYMDEALGWSCAALGFMFQLYMGFALPFLLRLAFFPLEFAEYYLMWTVSD